MHIHAAKGQCHFGSQKESYISHYTVSANQQDRLVCFFYYRHIAKQTNLGGPGFSAL